MNKLLAFAFAFIILSSLASAWDFDNRMLVDNSTQVITFRDSILGIPTTRIADARLETPQVNFVSAGKDVMVGAFWVNLSDTEYRDWVSKIETYDLKNGWNQVNKEYTIKKRSYEMKLTPLYKIVCINNTLANGTRISNCSEVFDRNALRLTEVWTPIENATLRNGYNYIGLFTDVNPNEYMEWIPTMFGVRNTLWASWNSSLNTDLRAYWDFDVNESLVRDSLGKSNMTPIGNNFIYNSTGKIDGARSSLGSAINGANISAVNGFNISNTDFTFNFWLRTLDTAGELFDIGAPYSTTQRFFIEATQVKLFLVNSASVTTIDQRVGPAVNDGNWKMISIVRQGTKVKLYVNGTNYANYTADPGTIKEYGPNWFFMQNGDSFLYGSIDEFGVWNRSLSSGEITYLYNNGDGMSYEVITPTPPGSISISLVSPTDNFITNRTSPTQFNYTITPNLANITNSTLSFSHKTISASVSVFNNSYALSNSSQNFSYTYPNGLLEGNWTWNIKGCYINQTFGHNCNFSTSNYTFIIDTTAPTISITSPVGGQGVFLYGLNLSANYSITDANLQSCILEYNNINTSISCSLINRTFKPNGITNTLNIWANDSAGNLNKATTSWIFDLFENGHVYNSLTSSLSSETFIYNFSYPSAVYNSIVGYLVYNNTKYLGTLDGSTDNRLITSTLEVPVVQSTTNKSFYWEFILSNATGSFYFNSTFRNQTVQNISIDDCSTYTNKIINYTLYDEDSLTILNNPPQNSTVEINFKLGNSILSNYFNYYTNKSGKNSIILCTANPINSSLRIDSEVKYYSDNYVTEYHNLQNYSVNKSTSTINISLYDLLSTSSQEFLITFKDSNYLVVSDALIEIQRQFIPQGSFITVEIPKTDSQGRTIGHFVLNDILYNIYIKKNGRTLAVYNNIRLYCATSECTLNLNEQAGTNIINDMTKYLGVVYSTDYDKDTRIYLFQFTVDDSSSKNFNLTITNLNSLNKETICSTTLSASSGSLQCTIPTSYANQTLVATVYVNGVTLSTEQIQVSSIGSDFNKIKYILAFMLVLSLVGMAATSGKAGATMLIGLVGLVLVGGLYLIDYGSYFAVGSAIVWIFIAGAILIWKITSKGGEESG